MREGVECGSRCRQSRVLVDGGGGCLLFELPDVCLSNFLPSPLSLSLSFVVVVVVVVVMVKLSKQ